MVETENRTQPHVYGELLKRGMVPFRRPTLERICLGASNSKHPFLWVVRPDVAKGDSVILPDEFLEEVKDRGYIASWAPQELVLGHKSVGVFLTHCGWNSIMESVCEGNDGRGEGEGIEEKALEWRKKAIDATDIGGASYDNFNRLIHSSDLHTEA
ncbi:hypothetical protein M0R45_005080 [Rubus argutus]|uniref:Uncharacterized protein n=1 Tax=Rubus argutus TaxID=59490 RepID=A0AAW1YLK9_RUBAR